MVGNGRPVNAGNAVAPAAAEPAAPPKRDSSDASDPTDPSDRTDQTATSPACPACGRPMLLRTARKGKRAGSQFWGCSGFPECRKTQQI